MNHSSSISLQCPHCKTLCQFTEFSVGRSWCRVDEFFHIPYKCTNCQGIILTKWYSLGSDKGTIGQFREYRPIIGCWFPKVNLQTISNKAVLVDFQEAIDCYNHDSYNASMMMARRAIQQEMISKGAQGANLYQQIESTGISSKLKLLLHKVKNFGNNGAHPDFCLFNGEGEEVVDKKKFAELSLEFLDRYFSDEYEIDNLLKNAPKSENEMKK